MADQVDAIMTDTTLLLTATSGTDGTQDVVGHFNTGGAST